MNNTPTDATDETASPPVARHAIDPLLLEGLRRRLITYAVRLVWNRDDAEEIVQEAFRLAVQRGLVLENRQDELWMYRTVSNLCLNQRRKRRPQPLESWIELGACHSPFERLEQAEQMDALRRAVGELPPQQRVALIMRTMEQMSYDDIAVAMDLSSAAVRTHVHLARRALMHRMESPE